MSELWIDSTYDVTNLHIERKGCPHEGCYKRIAELDRQVQMHKNHADRLAAELKEGGVMAAEHCHDCPICEGYFTCSDDECSEDDLCGECSMGKRITELEVALMEIQEHCESNWFNADTIVSIARKALEGK